jgi:hypothetical protein
VQLKQQSNATPGAKSGRKNEMVPMKLGPWISWQNQPAVKKFQDRRQTWEIHRRQKYR